MQKTDSQRSVSSLLLRSVSVSSLSMGLVLGSTPAFSNEDSLFFAGQEVCPADIIDIPTAIREAIGLDTSTQEIVLESDTIDTSDGNAIELSGNAQVVQGSQAIFANKIIYKKDSYSLNARENITLHTPGGDRLNMATLNLDMQTMIGDADKVSFQLARRDHHDQPAQVIDLGAGRYGTNLGVAKDSVWDANWDKFDSVIDSVTVDVAATPEHVPPAEVRANLRGEAEKLFFEGVHRQRLTKAAITSCRQGQDSVYIKASEMVLDHATGVGVGTNMSVRFFGVPIFYFPKASFPINGERKTGFLFPSIGSIEDSGTVVEVPYYINIAENRDATITMRYLSDRGVQLRGEFRYLGEDYDGLFMAEALPGDDVFGDDRSAFSFDHKHRFGAERNWEATVDLQDVSDTDYLDDFANTVGLSSTSFLDQRAEVKYADSIMNFEVSVKDYVTVDPALNDLFQPYARLPRIRFGAENPVGFLDPLRFGIDTEYVKFDHPTDQRIDGTRIDATPYISLPLEAVYGYVTPQISLRHTQYSLNNVAPGDPDNPSRSVPIFSLDSSIAFERPTTWQGREHYQTLEPRLFYVYAPEENQDDLPDFDTGGGNLDNIGNFYRDNRFFGPDRVGDANRVTLGVTSRVIDAEDGQERMKAEAAQIFYFDDRVVTLDEDDPIETEDRSELFAGISGQFNEAFSAGLNLTYDPEESEVSAIRFGTLYEKDSRNKLSLNYSFDSGGSDGDDREQVSMSAYLPLAKKWQVSLHNTYDIEESENRSLAWGITYDACCWAARISGEKKFERDGEEESAVFLTLELKDLGKFSTALSTPPEE